MGHAKKTTGERCANKRLLNTIYWYMFRDHDAADRPINFRRTPCHLYTLSRNENRHARRKRKTPRPLQQTSHANNTLLTPSSAYVAYFTCASLKSASTLRSMSCTDRFSSSSPVVSLSSIAQRRLPAPWRR